VVEIDPEKHQNYDDDHHRHGNDDAALFGGRLKPSRRTGR
jgi:hypothetical protein